MCDSMDQEIELLTESSSRSNCTNFSGSFNSAIPFGSYFTNNRFSSGCVSLEPSLHGFVYVRPPYQVLYVSFPEKCVGFVPTSSH